MKNIIKTLCAILLGTTILSVAKSNSAAANAGGYINVTFALSCRSISLPIPYSSIAADPDYLMDIWHALEKQLCNNSESGSEGGLNVEEDEVDDDTTKPANP
ncbi:MAG TPA: hypothetical protein IAB87_05770 [Candidatus Coprenecus merdipullorum]|nr:hypothetical protein [Candidatus Coprenecus merdipullorum]